MGDQLKNIMIGLFVIAALAILIFVLMFLHPSVGDEGRFLRVRFSNIDKVNIGTRVTYAGKPVGEVVRILEVEEGRAGPTDSSGRIYLYELELEVDSSVHVFNSDAVSLRTSGLLGEKNVEITPYAPKPGQELRLMDKQVIFAAETASVEDSIKQIQEVANKIDSALSSITDLFDLIKEKEIIEKVSATADNVKSITTALNKPKELEETLDNVHRLSARVNASWDKVDEILVDFKEAGANARTMATHGASVFDRVSRGEGAIGKLFMNEDLYLRTNSVLSKAETVMDDINHYGLLFHSDKGWQRLRARRMNLLQKLCTPQEFRNYFNEEIDLISTSLSRVAMVMEKEAACDPCGDLMLDIEFKKVFAELLRRVTMLEEEVRLYNTQVVESQVFQTELCP